MNSGIMPYLMRSSVRASARSSSLSMSFFAERVAPKPRPLLTDAAADDVLEAVERAGADEQDVGRVDLDQLLLRAIARAVRRDRRVLAFEDLEQRLLHAFAADVPRHRRAAALARDLVDLVDADDAALGLVDVAAGVAIERLDHALDVFADVAGLGERRGVGDGERHVELLGQRLREQRLAAARGAEQEDVALLHFDLAGLALLLLADALVMVVAPRPRAPSSRASARCSTCRAPRRSLSGGDTSAAPGLLPSR